MQPWACSSLNGLQDNHAVGETRAVEAEVKGDGGGGGRHL